MSRSGETTTHVVLASTKTRAERTGNNEAVVTTIPTMHDVLLARPFVEGVISCQ